MDLAHPRRDLREFDQMTAALLHPVHGKLTSYMPSWGRRRSLYRRLVRVPCNEQMQGKASFEVAAKRFSAITAHAELFTSRLDLYLDELIELLGDASRPGSNDDQ